MPEITHPELVKALCKSGETIANDLKRDGAKFEFLLSTVNNVIHVGQLLDKVKKVAIYNKEDPQITLAPVTDCFLPNLSPDQAHLLHMGIGIAGEAAELLEAIFDHIVHKKPLDVENLIEELGDLDFYEEGVKQAINVSSSTVLEENIKKLSKRYKNMQYSDESAQTRADKTTIH